MMTETNDVWSTINKGIQAVASYQLAKVQPKMAPAVASTAQTQAAPSGKPSWTVFNPFPGMFGPYPQADGTPQQGAGAFAGFNLGPVLIIGAVVIVVLAMLRR